jgi:hypothetical protein
VESETGQGSTFRVFIPLSTENMVEHVDDSEDSEMQPAQADEHVDPLQIA